MADSPPLIAFWRGKEGRTYEFHLDTIGWAYKARPGIFGFFKGAPGGEWLALFVGASDDFSRDLTPEFENHPAWECIATAGATHIGTLHWPGSPDNRALIVRDLLGSFWPSCNFG